MCLPKKILISLGLLCDVKVRLIRRANKRARMASDVSVEPVGSEANQVKEKIEKLFPERRVQKSFFELLVLDNLNTGFKPLHTHL